MWVLRFQFEGRVLRIPVARALVVGRSADCDVALQVPGVSRRHCEVLPPSAAGAPLRIRDLGSSAGTFLNERSLEEADLAEGDTLRIGPVWVHVQRGLTQDWRSAAGETALPHRMGSAETFEETGVPEREFVPLDVLDVLLPALDSDPEWGRRWAATLGFDDVEITCSAASGEVCLWPFGETAPGGATGALGFQGMAGDWTLRWAGAGRPHAHVALKALVRVLDVLQVRGNPREDRPHPKEAPPPARIVGLSGLWEKVEGLIDTDLPLLVTGETGVGKEVVCRAIHCASRRVKGPFEAVHCAAVPDGLFESELFGIEPSTATGVSGREGRLKAASGGTVFLDEVADVPLASQAKLLRVIEEGRVTPVGGRRSWPLQVRWLAATNRNLREAVSSGTFREDLYFRLRGAELRVPPLRERRGDIPALARLFLNELETAETRRIQGLSLQAFRSLMAHPWPGNVRELKMEIKRAYYLADEGGLIQSTHLSEEVRGAESRPGTAPKGPLAAERRSAVERAVRGALRDAGGRVTAAAEALGITRQALSRHMRLLGIRSQEYHPREG